jgi:hypothetical protein
MGRPPGVRSRWSRPRAGVSHPIGVTLERTVRSFSILRNLADGRSHPLEIRTTDRMGKSITSEWAASQSAGHSNSEATSSSIAGKASGEMRSPIGWVVTDS